MRALGTLFDRNLSDKTPSGAQGHVDLRGPNAGTGHSTQHYDDNTRVSWNHNAQNDQMDKLHWTDQSKAKGSSGRHTPPGHAR